jgi:RNA polymerase sigma-70 factor (ECF subfamily)
MDQSEEVLADRLRQRDAQALGELFSRHRERLWKLVCFRLHPRLNGRVDADDVLQEAYLSAADRIGYFGDKAFATPFVWLRLIVLQTLSDLHRRHLAVGKRDAHLEIPMQHGWAGRSTSASLAAQFAGSITSPSAALARAEVADRLEAAIETMNPIDREVLALRHFEELDNQEVAEVLDIEPKAASNRYIRALQRLKEILSEMSGIQDQQP